LRCRPIQSPYSRHDDRTIRIAVPDRTGYQGAAMKARE
jgi:hypothetical protein